MVRRRDEDMLEPILPKHPPVASDDPVDDAGGGPGAAVSPTRPSWDRLVLVGCAVVATLALVIVALRTNSIANDQRVQTCQIRVYAAEQSAFSGGGGRESQQRLARELAECVGSEPPGDADEELDQD